MEKALQIKTNNIDNGEEYVLKNEMPVEMAYSKKSTVHSRRSSLVTADHQKMADAAAGRKTPRSGGVTPKANSGFDFVNIDNKDDPSNTFSLGGAGGKKRSLSPSQSRRSSALQAQQLQASSSLTGSPSKGHSILKTGEDYFSNVFNAAPFDLTNSNGGGDSIITSTNSRPWLYYTKVLAISIFVFSSVALIANFRIDEQTGRQNSDPATTTTTTNSDDNEILKTTQKKDSTINDDEISSKNLEFDRDLKLVPVNCAAFKTAKYICNQNKVDCQWISGKCVKRLVASGKSTSKPTKAPTLAIDAATRYNIEVVFLNPSVASNKIMALFTNAARIWQKAIVGDLPSQYIYPAGSSCYNVKSTQFSKDIVVDDLMIFANLVPMDGVSGILGSAGPCVVTQGKGNQFTRVGLMQFDVEDVELLVGDNTFQAVIVHEMAHVIGIGTLWPMFNLKAPNFMYTGKGGLLGHTLIGGVGQPRIESDGGGGTAGGHWDQDMYDGEVMTGWLGEKSILSALTLQSLTDLGYKINPAAAGPFKMLSKKPAGFQKNLRSPHEHSMSGCQILTTPKVDKDLPYIDGRPQFKFEDSDDDEL